MGRFRSGGLRLAVAVLSFLTIAGCGGGTKAGPPLFPGHITLTPAVNTSLVLGQTLGFTASAQTASGTNLNVTISYSSSDTSILNLASNGVACAGQWNANFTACTPGGTGVVLVTASALGATSDQTYVFVHPSIDSVTVGGVLLNGIPVQEPCLSQTQSMTLEAHAFHQGTDVTASVGPFTFTANNPTVVNLLPLVNTAYNFATNQVTAAAVTPGITHIYASADGVTSASFQQPQYTNSQSQTSPVLDFFATCPIQSIQLELGSVGSQQTSFVTAKGTSESIFATVTDIMGVTSLPNTNGGIILTKTPLTWTSTHPGVLPVSSSCLLNCTTTSGAAGAGNITASCTPPTCNIGFPTIPATLSTPAQISACTQFFHAQYPQFASCQQLIPVPVYAETAVTGVATGAPITVSVLAGSTGCAHEPPSFCSSSVYFLSTAKASTGNENPLPTTPNSLLFDFAGDKIYMGSDFGAQLINPSNFGTANNPYSALGSVTGTALAVSNNGNIAAFSDTIHTPNQVYIVNAGNPSALSATPLTIPNATVAGFSPDGLKTFIVGGSTSSSLYVYSNLQALQGPIALSGPANAIAFAPNSAFAFVSQAANGSVSANLSAFSNCTNQLAATVPLPASPLIMKALPNVHIDGKDSYGNTIPDGIHLLAIDTTGIDVITATLSAPASGALCPQGLTFISGDPLRAVQRIELGEGTLQPINFFASPDGTQLYVVSAGSGSIFVYNFLVGSVTGGIQLVNNATPITANISVDDATIVIAGSDNQLHEISTAVGGADLIQLPFPNIPNYLNAFCSFTPSAGPCTLNTAITKP